MFLFSLKKMGACAQVHAGSLKISSEIAAGLSIIKRVTDRKSVNASLAVKRAIRIFAVFWQWARPIGKFQPVQPIIMPSLNVCSPNQELQYSPRLSRHCEPLTNRKPFSTIWTANSPGSVFSMTLCRISQNSARPCSATTGCFAAFPFYRLKVSRNHCSKRNSSAESRYSGIRHSSQALKGLTEILKNGWTP